MDRTGKKYVLEFLINDKYSIEIEDEIPVPADLHLSPEQEVFQKQHQACYEDCVNDLPESYQQVMVLSKFDKKTVNEIADILGLSEEAVKIRLHRGKEKFLQILKCHCKAEDWL